MRRFPRFVCYVVVFLVVGSLCAYGGANKIVKGPYLQNVKTTAITIMWETKAASPSRVDYGLTPDYGWFVEDSAEVEIHEMTLEGLTADELYHYKVSSGSLASEDNTFQTAPPAGTPFRFAAYGDTRTYPSDHAAVIQAIIASGPEFVLHSGDLVENGTEYSQWGRQFFDPTADLMKNTTMFPALGNHENNSHWYYDLFSLPAAESGSTTEAWYSFDYSNAHFIALDTCQNYAPGSTQYQWLVSDLQSPACANATWRFVCFHHPAYSSGSHGGTSGVQQYLVPLFEQYEIDMVFNGHDHFYERSHKDDVYYIVTGGGGAPLRDWGVSSNPYRQVSETVHHHCVLDVSDALVQFKALRNDGSEIDSLVLAGPVELHDVAVTGIDAPASVTQGETATIDVHVANEGNCDETFDVVLTDTTAGGEPIGTQPVTLSLGQATTVTFYWQTDETTSLGDHILQADAGPVTGETDLSDNTMVFAITVLQAGVVDDTADQDIPVSGTVAGTFQDTHASDDGYEAVTERESGGKPSNRYSYLEHKWTVSVSGGGTVTFHVEAHKTGAEDNFVFAYSTNDSDYTNMVTVTKTADDDQYQTFELPADTSGNVYIRLTDTDRTPGKRDLDTISIDHLFIRSEP